MDYKEKYEHALERAKKYYSTTDSVADTELIELIFPELKESEDEKIRKEIIGFIKNWKNPNNIGRPHDFPTLTRNEEQCNKYIAWLKKQGKTITVDIDKMVDEFAHTEVKDYGTPSMIEVDAYRKGINDTLRLGLKLEKQSESIKIKKGKNYLCTKTHKYAGVEWIEGVKYYSPEDYSLVNQGCTCYCPKYSKEEHNNFFKEVEYDAWLEKQGTKELDPRYENLEELLAADDIYQMSMNDAMVNEAKEKAAKALSELSIGKLLGFEKQGEQKASYATIVETGDGGINALVTKELPTNDCDKQKPVVIIPKFKVGDWVVCEVTCSVDQIKNCIENLSNHKYGYDLTNGGYISSDEVNHYRLWTIEDAKDGDVLVSKNNQPFIYNGKYDAFLVGAYCGINYAEAFILAQGKCSWTGREDVKPASKKQREQLFQEMKEAGYKWDADNKELNQIISVPLKSGH